MRKLTFAPFLCLLAFSPPKNVHNTKSESVTKTWPSTRMKSPFWASIVAWALFIYVPSRLNAPRSGRSQAKQPKDFDCDSSPPFHSIPPNPGFILKFMAFSSISSGLLCIIIDFFVRGDGELYGLRAVCRIRLSFLPEENLLKTLSLGA